MKMLKTNVDNIAKPVKPLILLGILKAYITNPVIFLIRVKYKAKTFKKQISDNYPDDFIEIITLFTSIYSLLLEKVDKEKAFSIVKAIGIPIGLSVQMANFRYVEDDRTFENLIKYQQRTNREGPTKLNKIKIMDQDEKCYRFRVHNCIFMKAFSELGMPELTQVMCEVDNAIFNVYLPERVVFHRDGTGNRIADGAEYCTFVCENIARQPVTD